MKLKSLHELIGVRMTRAQKNLLAQCGVMILEQNNGAGTDIVVRHQLTTNMTTVQTRETSVIAVGDFCSKYLRTAVDPYIGKYNITSEVVSMVEASFKTACDTLKNKLKIINDYKNIKVYQDASNPDTLVVTLSVLPPYPCNYIDITLGLE
jgi:hypothetical protein